MDAVCFAGPQLRRIPDASLPDEFRFRLDPFEAAVGALEGDLRNRSAADVQYKDPCS